MDVASTTRTLRELFFGSQFYGFFDIAGSIMKAAICSGSNWAMRSGVSCSSSGTRWKAAFRSTKDTSANPSSCWRWGRLALPRSHCVPRRGRFLLAGQRDRRWNCPPPGDLPANEASAHSVSTQMPTSYMKKTLIVMRYEGYRQPEQKEVRANCPIYCCNCIVAAID